MKTVNGGSLGEEGEPEEPEVANDSAKRGTADGLAEGEGGEGGDGGSGGSHKFELTEQW